MSDHIGRQNSAWQSAVLRLLKQGLGVEDIAVTLNSDLEDVRREIKILRESGELNEIYGARK